MLLNNKKLIASISLIAFMFAASVANAGETFTSKVASAFKIEQVKSSDAKAIVLAKGQNNLPKQPPHC